MVITGADNSNIAVLMSQADAKVITEALARLSSADLIDITLKGSYGAFDVVGATSSFVSNVGNALELLRKMREKHEKEDAFHCSEPPTEMIQ